MATPWPCDIGNADPGEYHPAADLFAIIENANLNAGLLRNTVIGRACDCARDHAIKKASTTWDTATKHCEWVRLARNRADAMDWSGCVQALKHMGLSMASTPTLASPSPWPCDFSPATPAGDNPDEDLFAVIDIANIHAPEPTAVDVIDRACSCAKHPKKQVGTMWNTEQKHVDWCTLARTRAAAHAWSLCIDALDHTGGGGDEDDGDDGAANVVMDVIHEFVQWFRSSNRYELIRKKLPDPPRPAPRERAGGKRPGAPGKKKRS